MSSFFLSHNIVITWKSALQKKSKELCLFFFFPLESIHDMKKTRKHWQPGAPQTLLNFLAGADITSACPTMAGNELGEKVLAFIESSEHLKFSQTEFIHT